MSTLQQYRAWINQELSGRDLCSFTADASGHTTSTVVDTLQKTSISANQRWQDVYLFIPAAVLTADKVRQVSSFAASTGTFTVDRVYSASTIPNSAAYELHPYIEPLTDLTLLINESLKRCLVVAEFNFAPEANSYTQDITAQASWLTNRRWVRGVAKLGTDGAQQQTLTEAGSPSGGTFTVTYRGATSGNINYDASASTMQTALRLLPELGSVTVTRTGTSTNFVWTVTMVGAKSFVPLMSTTVSGLTGGSSPSVTAAISQNRGILWPVHGTCRQQANKVYLDTNETFLSTDRLYISAISRAYDQCRATSTGTFGDRSGLAAEAHEAIPSVEWVGYGALTVAARRALNSLTPAMQDKVAKSGQRWAYLFEKQTAQNFDLKGDAPLELQPLETFGPGSSSSYPRRWYVGSR